MAKKQELFVWVARAMGAGLWRILGRHILPSVASPIVVRMFLDIGFTILTVGALGFITIAVKPPTPEWGLLLAIALSNLPNYWWTAVFPGLAILLTVYGFNRLGEGLHDMLNPRDRVR